MEQAVVSVQNRTETGSSSSRKLRHHGRVPAVIYGHGKPARSVSVDEIEFARFLAHHSTNTIIRMSSDDEDVNGVTVMVKEVQKDPTRGSVLHVDFQEISLSETVTVSVPLVTSGRPADDGGIVEHVLNEITVEAVVTDIPPQLTVDISGLGIGDSLRVSDLQVPEGVTIMDDPDQTVIHIVAPRAAEEPSESEEEDLEEAEAEEAEAEDESE